MKLLDWSAPGRYRIVFSTRLGGVSEGPFRSLNLGLLTDDEPERVLENRRLLCAATGADPGRAAMAWQQHGARVVEAAPLGILAERAELERCDGLWSQEPRQAMVLLTADCLPVVLYRTAGEPALCVLHVGWRGLLAGIAEAGARALGNDAPVAAVIGPGIGPCCYAVEAEVAEPYRDAFGGGVLSAGRLDLWSSTERALTMAGVSRVERVDLCTACHGDLFFSHRRDRGRTGRQGVVAYVE